MNRPKLTYFDFHGGRGEVARLAFAIGEMEFEDDRVSFAEWESRREHTPFGALPILEVDGRTVAQSNAINRYVGKLVGLYPSGPERWIMCRRTCPIASLPDWSSTASGSKPIPRWRRTTPGDRTSLEINGGTVQCAFPVNAFAAPSVIRARRLRTFR
jgi:hypothetical protein